MMAFCFLHPLEQEFQAQLQEPRWSRVNDLSKKIAAEIAVNCRGAEKLGVVEYVKRFETEFERLRFGEANVFGESEIRIEATRAVEETPIRGAGRAQSILREKRGIEERLSVTRI